MNKFYVYELTTTDGIPFYIGKGMRNEKYDRLNFHKYSWHTNRNLKLKNKINKIGNKFNTKILLTSSSEKECLNLEIELIKKIGKENLCNLTDGGEGVCGYQHTEKTKKIMADSASTPRRIKIATDNVKKAIESNIGGRKLNSKNKLIHSLYKTHTIREIANELGISFYTVKRYIDEHGWYVPNKNRKPLTAEMRRRRAETTKKIQRSKLNPVLQFTKSGEFIREFSTAPEACDILKKSGRSSEITMVCNGKRHSAFGFIWKYKNI